VYNRDVSFSDQFLPQAASGLVVALVGAGVAWWLSKTYGERRARQERNLAAAEDVYRVYGHFFAAWKAWDFLSRKGASSVPPDTDPRVAAVLEQAATAEGEYETLLLRIAMEQDLSAEDERALWCLREAIKELRYSIRNREPLTWWSSDIHEESSGYEAYQTVKGLVALVTQILVRPLPRGTRRPGLPRSITLFRSITGNGEDFDASARWLEVGSQLVSRATGTPAA
jgi:hypothetical protein